MEVVQSADNFCGVEEGGRAVEPSSTSEVGEKFSTTDIRKQHVEEALIFGTPG